MVETSDLSETTVRNAGLETTIANKRHEKWGVVCGGCGKYLSVGHAELDRNLPEHIGQRIVPHHHGLADEGTDINTISCKTGVDHQMDRILALVRVKVVDEGGVVRQQRAIRHSGVPPDDELFTIDALMETIHGLVVVFVDSDVQFCCLLQVRHSEAIGHLSNKCVYYLTQYHRQQLH